MKNITAMLTAKIEEFAAKSGGVYDAKSDYSGRGMFGATCPGLQCSVNHPMGAVSDLLQFVLADDDLRLDSDVAARVVELLLGGACTDSLGVGGIVYWPDLRVRKEN